MILQGEARSFRLQPRRLGELSEPLVLLLSRYPDVLLKPRNRLGKIRRRDFVLTGAAVLLWTIHRYARATRDRISAPCEARPPCK
jgi:hypothetical protein